MLSWLQSFYEDQGLTCTRGDPNKQQCVRKPCARCLKPIVNLLSLSHKTKFTRIIARNHTSNVRKQLFLLKMQNLLSRAASSHHGIIWSQIQQNPFRRVAGIIDPQTASPEKVEEHNCYNSTNHEHMVSEKKWRGWIVLKTAVMIVRGEWSRLVGRSYCNFVQQDHSGSAQKTEPIIVRFTIRVALGIFSKQV